MSDFKITHDMLFSFAQPIRDEIGDDLDAFVLGFCCTGANQDDGDIAASFRGGHGYAQIEILNRYVNDIVVTSDPRGEIARSVLEKVKESIKRHGSRFDAVLFIGTVKEENLRPEIIVAECGNHYTVCGMARVFLEQRLAIVQTRAVEYYHSTVEEEEGD